ncbi:MAG: NTP transferase domain-containing protein [Bacteriovorax sp.]|nr:NTP transferase domain-containing protein [Bacteriovorax sp.]
MQIDHALILSAGLGTRMGGIGKKLPKALWPVFYKSLLELQVDYCHDLGIKKIFINTHFLSEEIENFVKSDSKFSDVIILHEDPLLDSGGAIHNMASRGDVNYSGNLLLVNADQFLFFDHKYFEEALSGLENSRAALFGITVDKTAKYNETVIVDDILNEIRKNIGTHNYVTYSGLGILKLDGLNPSGGITKFFETVANYKKERIQFVVPKRFEYWDFGTAEIYFESIKEIYFNLKDTKPGMLMDFLKKHNAIKGDEGNFYSQELNSVSLEGTNDFEKNSIVGKGIVQPLL